jgi:hypothetical protein
MIDPNLLRLAPGAHLIRLTSMLLTQPSAPPLTTRPCGPDPELETANPARHPGIKPAPAPEKTPGVMPSARDASKTPATAINV